MRLLILSSLVASIAAIPTGSALRASTTQAVCVSIGQKCATDAQKAAASAYCASHLSIPMSTVTVSSTKTVAPTCSAAATPYTKRSQEALALPSASVCIGLPAGSPSLAASCACLSLPSTLTTTATAVATVTGPFKLQASGGPAAGQYGSIKYNGYESVEFTETELSDADEFVLDQSGRLLVGGSGSGSGKIAAEVTMDSYGTVFLQGPAAARSNSELSCSIEEHSCALSCKANGFTLNVVCNDFEVWRLGRPHANLHATATATCSKFTPTIVPS